MSDLTRICRYQYRNVLRLRLNPEVIRQVCSNICIDFSHFFILVTCPSIDESISNRPIVLRDADKYL